MGFRKKTIPEQVQTVPVPTNTALVHDAYMLVRHLQYCYRETTQDEELRHRLKSLFSQVLPSDVTENVLEALTRPYVPAQQTKRPSVVDEGINPINESPNFR